MYKVVAEVTEPFLGELWFVPSKFALVIRGSKGDFICKCSHSDWSSQTLLHVIFGTNPRYLKLPVDLWGLKADGKEGSVPLDC
jgi:hypothetical protein